MRPSITVILCTHNPRPDYLQRVLAGLRQQTLALSQWELVVIDNASTSPLAECLDLSWHPQGRVVPEPHLGLTRARQRGFWEAQSEILVYVDDDNVLATNYLEQVQQAFAQYPQLGVAAGKALPEFEAAPPPWLPEFYSMLALRDFGDTLAIIPGGGSERRYPDQAPAGAGMALRRTAFADYWASLGNDSLRLTLGRTGQNLVSGEDNDIVLTLLNRGWDGAYLPQLQLIHLIAARRLQPDYLARLNFAASQSWVQVLDIHGIRLWPAIAPWTVGLRQAKAWLRLRPWQSPAAYVRWRGICGLLAGQAQLAPIQPSI